MKLIEFIKNRLRLIVKANDKIPLATTCKEPIIVDRTSWTGQDFEFLIVGDIDVFDDFDNIMTPNSLEWIKLIKPDWHYYKVGEDEFSYSIEEPGIQMTFNKEILFAKAKKIGDEVIANIHATGQNAELIILDNKKVYRFE